MKYIFYIFIAVIILYIILFMVMLVIAICRYKSGKLTKEDLEMAAKKSACNKRGIHTIFSSDSEIMRTILGKSSGL